ncbi:uncharacterized protein Tco025E_07308 [Trypanosoma conorhini]|uniref:Uncharacterized protein n=1 Tax=Trypanosoma conorhini TaxID=83891 RepID=A0A3R7KJH0_9TRYP|nr:uncharacterized protein Tco025E_07308 [Trypanosoma conorhini]RNF07715.1 hypothetical protein Tco025E_07308 [Trypanosoma conorhini]
MATQRRRFLGAFPAQRLLPNRWRRAPIWGASSPSRRANLRDGFLFVASRARCHQLSRPKLRKGGKHTHAACCKPSVVVRGVEFGEDCGCQRLLAAARMGISMSKFEPLPNSVAWERKTTAADAFVTGLPRVGRLPSARRNSFFCAGCVAHV